MQLKNPLKMNDWDFGQVLIVVCGIQFALLVLIGLGSLGLDVFFVRQLIGLIYLTFIPGILLLRIFRIHRLSNIEALLYISGLSLATVMFVGFFSNTFLPVLGVNRPISTVPLAVIMTATVFGLCALAFVTDGDFSHPTFIDTKGILSAPLLFLCILPFISIAGAQLMNITGNNSLSMLLLVLLAIIPLLVVFDHIPSNLYPLAVFVTAIALLYDVTLVSPYVTGYDAQLEHFFATSVSTSGLWDPTIPNDLNSMLSVAMLPPILASICNVSVDTVFKVIYQFYFALVPLGLYLIYQRQTTEKTAFLSVFYFSSIFVFYAVMTQLMRQEIAELFVVLLILLIIEQKMKSVQKSSLLVIFGFSLIVSHYGLSYLYIVILILTALASAFFWPPGGEARKNLHTKAPADRKARRMLNMIKLDWTARSEAISSVFILLLIVLAGSWYIYVGSAHPAETFASVLQHGFSNMYALFSPQAATPTGIAVSGTSPMREITLFLTYIAEFFVVLGFVALIRNPQEMRFTRPYFGLICANFAIVLVGLAIPLLIQYETLRAYQIVLIVLSPLFVIGGMIFFKAVARVAKLPFTKRWKKASWTVLSLFLMSFLLLNSGWVYTITNDNPTQFALNSHIDAARFSDQEVLAAQWMISSKGEGTELYGDEYGHLLLDSLVGPQSPTFHPYTTFARGADVIILFRSTNIAGEITMQTGYASLNDSLFYQKSLVNSNLVYDNGGARAYHP